MAMPPRPGSHPHGRPAADAAPAARGPACRRARWRVVGLLVGASAVGGRVPLGLGAAVTGELLEAALAYAAAGYEVFPLRGKLPRGSCPECTPGTPERPNPRYRPHAGADCAGTPGHDLCHGLLAATSARERIERWW